jgi:hypothetical protein
MLLFFSLLIGRFYDPVAQTTVASLSPNHPRAKNRGIARDDKR